MVRTKWSQRENELEKITESKIAINQSCLSKEEQEEVYDLFVKYRGSFSLRNEIGTFPNIEIDLQVIDKSPF